MGKLFNVTKFAEKNGLQKRNLYPILCCIKQKQITELCFDEKEGGFWVDQLCHWLIKKECTTTSLELVGDILNDEISMSKFKNALSLNTSLKCLLIRNEDVYPKVLADFIEFIEKNQTLEEFGLVNLGIMANSVYDFDLIENRSLKYLTKYLGISNSIIDIDLSCNCLINDGAVFLNKIMMNRNNFRTIKINHCQLRDEGMLNIIEGLKNNRDLRRLEISDNNIKYEGMTALSNCFEFLCEIRVLILNVHSLFSWNRNEFGVNGFTHFCKQLKHLKHLEELYLQSLNINDNEFLLLTESLQHCIQLKILDVSNNKIKHGFDHLERLLKPHSKLQTLRIEYNPISKRAMKNLNICLNNTRILKSLYIGSGSDDKNEMEGVIKIINSNNNLETLSFTGYFNHVSDSIKLYTALSNNTSLKDLELPLFTYHKKANTAIIYSKLSECLMLNNSLLKIHLYGRMNEDEDTKQINLKINSMIKPIPKANRIWNSNDHHKLTFPAFQQSLHTFLLCLKANQFKTKLKIPKFVLFEIIKFIVRKSFLSQKKSKKHKMTDMSIKKQPPLKKNKK